MTATVYECANEKVPIQTILTASYTTGKGLVIVPKGSNYVNIVIYDLT